MIYKEVEYPWGKHWICYDSWTFKKIERIKFLDKLGNESFQEKCLEDEIVTSQGKYVLLDDLWEIKKDGNSKKYKIKEYTSNYYEVIVNDNTTWVFVKIGHLSTNQNINNEAITVRDCLIFLEENGWSELIDERWRDDVFYSLKKNIPNITEETIEETLNIVIV